jgi:phosphoribosylamine---glycine ligase
MRILVVGAGGREHALLWKLSQSPRCGELYCAPGNGGTAKLAENLSVRSNDIDGLVQTALDHRIDLVVVGPEEPLSLGLADRLRARGVPVFGNSAAATRIESSKSFAKEVMAAAGIPTARSVVVQDLLVGLTALGQFDLPVVIKADGLAAGKGVVVALSRDEARYVLTAFLEDRALGQAGTTVVIEECLVGQEVSVHALVSGESIVALPTSCDHKRVNDGDKGPNTGGMGAFAPAQTVTAETEETIRRTILEPLAREMKTRGAPLQGALYPGLMLTAEGPMVIEFNARLGDPETQVMMPLLDADLADLLMAVASDALDAFPPPVAAPGAAVGVVLASGGYPGPFLSGIPISGLDRVPDDLLVFHSGTRVGDDGGLVTSGGRVMTVVGTGADVAIATGRAYAGVAEITFEGMHVRKDIARQKR